VQLVVDPEPDPELPSVGKDDTSDVVVPVSEDGREVVDALAEAADEI
jgi:hypothetical protein